MLFLKNVRPKFSNMRHRYFGYDNGRLRGAVFCKKYPEQKFNVALCDQSGNIVSQALANLDLTKGDIPPGYGFEIPIPIEWAALKQPSIEFQFRVLETGKIFPAEPRSVKVARLRELDSQLMLEGRPLNWEDDISRNALDTAPFATLPAPCEFRDSELEEMAKTLAIETPGSVSLRELADRDTLPIPVPKDREGYAPGQDAYYWLFGLSDYLKVMRTAESLGKEVDSLLDLGCASGRVLRHFACQSNVTEIWGSDINVRHNRWLLEFMPSHVRPIANSALPVLPLRDSSVDVVTAFSVFTHIDTFETCWLAELSRILRPGGIAYLTVHNEATWENLRGEIDNPNDMLVKSVLAADPGFAEAVHEPMPDTRIIYRYSRRGPYRAQVFHSNGYLRRVWGRFFDIREIRDHDHNRQAVVVMTAKK